MFTLLSDLQGGGDDTSLMSPMSPRTYNPEKNKDIGDIEEMSPVSLLFSYKDNRDNGDMYPMSPVSPMPFVLCF